jgi:hypothetical protein
MYFAIVVSYTHLLCRIHEYYSKLHYRTIVGYSHTIVSQQSENSRHISEFDEYS